jgi:hypothetical protein
MLNVTCFTKVKKIGRHLSSATGCLKNMFMRKFSYWKSKELFKKFTFPDD